MSVVRCARCRSYIDKDDALRVGIQSFCDRSCAYSYQSGFRKSNTSRDGDYRDSILKLDNYRCRMCLSSHMLHVHHVVYRGQQLGLLFGGHNVHNLITLCEKCHMVVHRDKHRWQKVLLATIWFRDCYAVSNITVNEVESYLTVNGLI